MPSFESTPKEVQRAHVMHELYDAQVKLADEEDEDLEPGEKNVIRQTAAKMAELAGSRASKDLHVIEPYARQEMERDLAEHRTT